MLSSQSKIQCGWVFSQQMAVLLVRTIIVGARAIDGERDIWHLAFPRYETNHFRSSQSKENC
jgi:hypothetical protein